MECYMVREVVLVEQLNMYGVKLPVIIPKFSYLLVLKELVKMEKMYFNQLSFTK